MPRKNRLEIVRQQRCSPSREPAPYEEPRRCHEWLARRRLVRADRTTGIGRCRTAINTEERHVRGKASADGRRARSPARTRRALSRRAPRTDAALRHEPGQGRRAQRVAPQPRIVERHGAAGRGKGSRLRREFRRHRAFPSGREHDGGADRVDRRTSVTHSRPTSRPCLRAFSGSEQKPGTPAN